MIKHVFNLKYKLKIALNIERYAWNYIILTNKQTNKQTKKTKTKQTNKKKEKKKTI